MNKIDPRLFAVGIGATVGVNTLATDNDPLAIAAGLAIGGGTGALMQLSTPDNLESNAQKAIGNVRKSVDVSVNTGRVQTFEELRKSVQDMASGLVKSSTSTSSTFDRSAPFSSLNKNTYQDFTRYLSTLTSEEDLRELHTAFKMKDDTSFVKASDLDDGLAKDYRAIHKIKEDANLASKQKALRSELKRLGYQGTELAEKEAKLESIIKNHKGMIEIGDGVINLDGVGKVQLTYEIGSGQDKAMVYANNRNMYDVKRVNVFGSSILAGHDSTAVADALGIKMADLFELNAQFNGKGIAPDDAIGMLASTGKFSPEQMSKIIDHMNNNYNYNEDASGLYKQHLLGHGGPVVNPSSHSIANSNTVEYKNTLDLDDTDLSLRRNELGSMKVTSDDGFTKSPMKQLQDVLSKKLNMAFYGVSADHVTQLPMPYSNTNKPLSAHVPIERNPMTVNNRAVVAQMNGNKLNQTVKGIIETLGSKHQYASAIALQGFSIDPDYGFDIPNKTDKKMLADIIANAFGADYSTGDGYGLANTNLTNRITTSGTTSVVMKKTSSNKYVITNEAMRRHISGQLTLDDMRKEALKGSTQFSKRVENALVRARDKAEALATAVATGKDEEIFEALKAQHKSYSKYASYQDFIKNNKKLAKASDKFDFMKKLASKSILGSALTGDSLYTQSFKDSSHLKVVRETRKMDKTLVKLQRAASTANFTDATRILNDLVKHNEEAKLFKESYEAYFPKPGTKVGLNSDLTPLEVKQSYRFLEFQGAMRAVNDSGGNVSEAIQFMYKGENRAGMETISKIFGTNSKEQIKHIDADTFSRIGFLHSLAKEDRLSLKGGTLELRLSNSSKPLMLKQSQLTGKNFIEELIKSGASKADIAMAKEQLNFFKHNVATISEDGGSGMKSAEGLYKNLLALSKDHNKTKAITDQVTSKIMSDMLINRVTKENLTTNQLKGLSNFAVSIASSERASADYLLTTLTSMKMSSDLKVSNYTNAIGTADEANQLKALQSFAVDILGDNSYSSGTFNIKSFQSAMDTQVDQMMHYYNNPNAVHELAQDSSLLNRLSNIFMAERTYRSESIGDTLIRLASINRRTESEAGSGKIDKSMSWNAQTQLKMNGISDDELAFFGKFNTKNLADLNAVMSIRLQDAATINNQINDGNIAEVKSALLQQTSKRRDALAKAGVNVDGLHGAYKLQSENKLGFKNIPIMLEDTALFGSYTDKHGNIKDSNLNSTIAKIIHTDMKLQEKGLYASERLHYEKSLEQELTHLANTLNPTLGGQDNILKKALAREGTNSRYSTMVPVSGALDELSKTKSAVSVSSEGLVKRFQQLGFDYKNLDDIEKAGHLSKGPGGLFKVNVDVANNVPLFGIINREPATGPGSARFVEYYLDKGLTNDSKSINIGRNDKLYKYFQFGDFDLDHVIEYMPDFKSNQYDEKIFKDILAKGTKVNDDLFKTIEYAKLLGVKGSNKDKIKSLFDVYEEHGGNFKSTSEWYEKYVEDVLLSKQKGGDRKSISPTVTKLASEINDAISGSGDNTSVAMRARVLSHYFVENLLKSQHIDNKTYGANPVSMAEQLANHLKKGGEHGKSKFNQEFANYIEDTVIANIKKSGAANSQELIDQTMGAVKLIQNSITNRDSARGPATPMHLRAPNSAKGMSHAVDDLIKATIGKAASVGVLSISEELVNEGNEMSLAQKGKLGYHKALETIKHNIGNNKKLLATAAGATVAAALLTQKKPDFGESRASANPSGMLMAPSKSILEDTAAQAGAMGSLNRAVEYIRPYRKDNSYVGIQATPTGEDRNLHQDMDNFLFGDGLSSVRILNQ